MKALLTTGKAAELCSVTPDAVLKWIKAGKLPALRTPGGHYRIKYTDLEAFHLQESVEEIWNQSRQSFQYCWEFNSPSGEIRDECQKCIVYLAKARRCYEMSQLPTGHSRSYCTISCEECDYFKLVNNQRANVLFVSNSEEFREYLDRIKSKLEYNIQITDCEYSCSMLIETYRPDFVTIDCSFGPDRAIEFARQLQLDPRIPFVRIILIGHRNEFPAECDREVFACVERPFRIEILADMFENLKADQRESITMGKPLR